MIYDYCCVDCGQRIDGRDVKFNLAKLLELEGIDPKLAMISYKELNEISEQSEDMYSGERVRVQIYLDQFLMLLGRNSVRIDVANKNLPERELETKMKIAANNMQDLEFSKMEDAFKKLIGGTMNQAERQKMVQYSIQSIVARFLPAFAIDEEDKDEMEDTGNYCAYLWVKPIFFEDEDEVYTLQYSIEENPVNLNDILEPEEIRGYCPHCGEPVIKGAGKYPHRLVGLLGAQSAGKTSIIISMLDEMANNFYAYDMEMPDRYLCDSRYYTINWNMKLFQNGWAVKKTVASRSKSTFNASMLLQPRNQQLGPQLITFIDIAGELCCDMTTGKWNPNAFREFPLINHCDIYLLCTCIAENSYGELDANGVGDTIEGSTVLNIAQTILKKRKEDLANPMTPPLCIVATKADLSGDAAGGNNQTPFDEILDTGKEFFQRAEVEKMRNLYITTQSRTIKNPLEWCMRTYKQLEDTAYISMMSCSALGGTRSQYEMEIPDGSQAGDGTQNQEPDNALLFRQKIEQNITYSGQPMGMRELWDWLLAVVGLKSIVIDDEINQCISSQDYLVPHVPSFDDSYIVYGNEQSRQRRVYRQSEAMERILAVRKLFINESSRDEDLYGILSLGFENGSSKGWWPFSKQRKSKNNTEQEAADLINSWG